MTKIDCPYYLICTKEGCKYVAKIDADTITENFPPCFIPWFLERKEKKENN